MVDDAQRSFALRSDAIAGIDAQSWTSPGALRRQAGDASRASRLGYQNSVKRAIDVIGASLLFVAAALPMLLIAMAVLISLGRPVIFRQRRVGRHGKLFTVYKFRTMIGDRRVAQIPLIDVDRRETHKSDRDPRSSNVGQRLRRWSLDELPQLWNVIRGDMSLVGPRPELPSIVDRYAPWQHERHVAKPGLTGFWQVYARGDGVMHERTDLDIAYVRAIGLRTDLKILLLTIPAIIGLKRGY